MQRRLDFFGFNRQKVQDLEHESDSEPVDKCPRLEEKEVSSSNLEESPSTSDVIMENKETDNACSTSASKSLTSTSDVIMENKETDNACSTSASKSLTSISSVMEMFPGKKVHQYDLCKMNMCTNMSKEELKLQAMKSYKFQHSWLSIQEKAFCEKSSIWWGIYVEGEGIFCYMCRKHDTINPQNKSKTFNMEPSTRFRPETFNDHEKTAQHQNAITTEMYQRMSCFQTELDKQDNVADDVLYKAFEAVYWVMKEEISNLKIKSLLNLLERLGIDDMKYFQHRSQCALREIFLNIGGTLEDKLVKELQEADHYGLMVDDVTDISVMEQMVTFIQYYCKKEGKVKTAFLSIDNLLEESDSANSEAITNTIMKNLKAFGLEKDKVSSFVSDGASVMVGSRSGVATKLKEVNPLIISIHCICHKLALACTDTLNNVSLSYIKNVHTWLMQLWSMFQNSPKKMAAFLKVQLSLKELNLTTEKSKKGASKRLKKACTTRWLSFDSSVKAVDAEYEAILQTLNALKEKDATSLGLYKKLKQVKFIATIYILEEILPLLSIVSKTFQKGTIDFSKIGPTLEYTKEQLNQVVESESPIVRLKNDLEEGKRLEVMEIKVTDHMITEVTNLLTKYVSALIENIDKRFGDSLPVLTALSIFDPLRVPEKDHVNFRSYGQNQMNVICNHFTSHMSNSNDKDEEIAQMVTEFAKFKYDMINLKKEIPTECKPEKAPCAVSSLEWSLQKIIEAAHFYPKLSCIADAILATPVSNAWPERGASCVKRIKNRLRSRISNDMLQALMHVSINGEKTR